MSRITLYNAQDKVIVQAVESNGLLQTVKIEPTYGSLVLCGGIDTKLGLFDINI
jgi:hypothetical protein